MTTTVKQFFKQFQTDEACLAHLFNARFGQGHTCPKCERKAKWYPIKAERAYSCQWCGNHLHPTVGTPFESSRTSLQMWFFAIYLFTTTRNGVAAKELQRQLGVTYKTAWRMGHEIRKHMAMVDGEEPLSGIVEADETWIGGVNHKGRGTALDNKTVVFGMLQRDGDLMTHVVPNVKQSTLLPLIVQNIEQGTMIHTDEAQQYAPLNIFGFKHESVQHRSKEYTRGTVHTNNIEGFWSHLTRAITSTHIHVSGKHLEKYAKEFEYRFNARKNPGEMLPELLGTFPKKKRT